MKLFIFKSVLLSSTERVRLNTVSKFFWIGRNKDYEDSIQNPIIYLPIVMHQ